MSAIAFISIYILSIGFIKQIFLSCHYFRMCGISFKKSNILLLKSLFIVYGGSFFNNYTVLSHYYSISIQGYAERLSQIFFLLCTVFLPSTYKQNPLSALHPKIKCTTNRRPFPSAVRIGWEASAAA